MTFGKTLPRLLVALALLVAFMVPRPAEAQDSGLGLGIVLGDPSGLSFKTYLGPTAAIDGGIGWGLINHGHLQAYLDFLWEWRLTNWNAVNPALYLGLGPKVGVFFNDDAFRVGARAPIGIAFQFHRAPIDIFIEIAAGLWITDAPYFDLDSGIGIRLWF